MRLADLSIRQLKDALSIYVEVAYQGEVCENIPELPDNPDESVETVLDCFEDESQRKEEISQRYVLRLGNRWYPFMKFVLEEQMIKGEFFLFVDTHDQMFKSGGADQQEFETIRQRNADLKRQIEERWAAADLPTVSQLKVLMSKRPLERQPSRNQRVLIVDDDVGAAAILSLLLEARGFEVEQVDNGKDAWERADPTRHDVVIMDIDMPVMDGLEATRLLKEDPSRAALPILLATAGVLDLSLRHRADAFLVKPFQVEILFSFLDHLLKPCHDEEAEPPPSP